MKRVLRVRLLMAGGLIAAVMWCSIPDYHADLNAFHGARMVRDRNGEVLRLTVGENDLLCTPVPLSETGRWTPSAVVAFEDKRFYRHGGIDALALCRAALQDAVSARVVSGASTLTTLVVKLTEPRRRTLWAKLVEAHHAWQMEAALSKEAILEQYLNRAPFGGNVYGIEAASRRWFGKPARNLSLAESALLAGLPQSPSRLRPDRFRERALQQRGRVLSRMLENGMITPEQFAAASRQPLVLRRQATPFRAPHFCDWVLRRYPERSELDTTFDASVQLLTEEALKQQVDALSGFGVQGGAAVVIDVRSGALLAMVGSPSFWGRPAGQVNGAVARRSPGSTLKPFAFAMAMDRGLCTPASITADVPMHFAGYTPRNFTPAYRGPVCVREALVQSLNIPALKCVERLGVGAFVDKLRGLGMTTLDEPASHYGLGIAVGGCEVSLLELANAYACLARGGLWRPLRLLQSERPAEGRRMFSEESAYMTTDILGGDERSAELFGHVADAVLPRVAWKSGTSSGFRDAWAVACNPDYVVAVWLGNPDASGVPQLVGGSAAGPVAGAVFRRLYPDGDSPWFEKPAGLRTRTVCAESGCVPSPGCRSLTTDFFIPRISPVRPCCIHHAAESGEEPGGLMIVSPAAGETFRLLSGARSLRQEIRMQASGAAASPLFWFMDEQFIGAATPDQPLFWPLRKGAHVVCCTDASGRRAVSRFSVE